MINQIIHGMGEEEYHSLPYISATWLKKAATENLASLREYLRGGTESSEALRLGWLCHLKTNCPTEWEQDVVCPPADLMDGISTKKGTPSARPKNTVEYRRRFSTWADQHPGKIHLSRETYEEVERIALALLESPCYTQCDEHEVVVLFEYLGRQAKARIDGAICQAGIWWLYDWKFMQTTKGFNYQILKYGYHQQMAFYKEAYERLNRTVSQCVLVGIDKTHQDPSYTVCAPLSRDLLNIGRRECEFWFHKIREAERTGVWPGAISPDEWTVPAGYVSSMDRVSLDEWVP